MMKAAVMTELNKMEIKEMPSPQPKAEEVLVKVKACSVCGSDIHAFKEKVFGLEPPLILGHEVAGIVKKVGDKVNGLKTGDRVALEPAVPCRECELCKKGKYHMCQNTTHLAVDSDGGFAEYVKLHYLNVHKIGTDIPFIKASLMEPIGVCLHGLKKAQLELGESILIVGNGPFGLIFTQLARLAGAGKVFVSGRRENRNRIARKYGARVIDIRDESVEEVINRETDNRGVDIVIDAAGTPSVFEDTFKVLRPGGRMVLFSYTKSEINLDISPVHMNEYQLIGSCRCPNTFGDVAQLISSKKLDLSEIITHVFPLDEIKKAFAVVQDRKQKCIKAVIEIN